LVNW